MPKVFIHVTVHKDGVKLRECVCECADAQCYKDCANQFLTVLGGLAAAGADDFWAPPQAKAAAEDRCGLLLSYHATDENDGVVVCAPPIHIPRATDAMAQLAGALFDQCCQHPAVKKARTK